ncbi:uncharacterized protein LOC106137817 [Amyelois transitella]|uniref:uncharacterized protein LOC106137817 n=1 Tax=Amyelois transitella TaxID=680683 RepID=UPI00067A99F7|nr:uncharacterized protein LOC106137817 [Amyelois transitella]
MKNSLGLFCIFSGFTIANSLSWSSTYNLKAVLRIPSANIVEPYQIWTDGETGNSRIDFYDGLDKMYRLRKPCGSFQYYKIHPVSFENGQSKNVCKIYDSTDNVVKVIKRYNYLPGPEQKFNLVDFEYIDNVDTTKWQYSAGHESDGLKFNYTYTVWVKSENYLSVPVRFDFSMKVDNSEMDYFRHDYTYFDTSKPDPKIFQIPNSSNCKIQDTSIHEPVDPLIEFVNPTIEHERINNAYDSFKLEYKKYYNDSEHRMRRQFFKNNLRLINSVNRQHKSYTLALNQLADLSDSELLTLGRLRVTPTNDSQYFDDNDVSDSVKSFDWREFNAISPIKDQTFLCGSCYAFTSAAAIESTFYIHNGCKGQVKEISEQAIIDCTWTSDENIGNSGCDSGDLYYTFSYIKKFGVPTRDSYGPYLAMEGVCQINAGKKIKISDFTKIPKNKGKIQKALIKNGPLAIALNGRPKTFIFYSKGVYDNANCANENTDLTHGVTLVGFGEESGKEYWILKNSYGVKWGEKGFMRIASHSNICGVMNLVFSVQFSRKNKINKCFLKKYSDGRSVLGV